MYYYGWIMLVSISLWVSLVAFVWALRSGQFAEQGRARYLPLADGHPLPPADHGKRRCVENYALLVVAALGTLGFLSAIVVSFIRLR